MGINTGPYKIVRHLFYSTFILFWIATPLALGSFLALIPGFLGVILLIATFNVDNSPLFQQSNEVDRFFLHGICFKFRFDANPMPTPPLRSRDKPVTYWALCTLKNAENRDIKHIIDT